MNSLVGRPSLARASVAAALLVLTLVGPTLAHAELVSSNPKNGAVLATPPTVVTLTFSETLDAQKSSFKLIGPDGPVGTGKVASDPSGMTLAGLSLAPGDYEIQWTSVAVDGHVQRGVLAFIVSQPTTAPPTLTPAAGSPPAPASPSAEPSVAPTAPTTPGPTVAPSPAPSPAPAPASASSGDVLLPIVAALALVAVVGAYLLRRSRRVG